MAKDGKAAQKDLRKDSIRYISKARELKGSNLIDEDRECLYMSTDWNEDIKKYETFIISLSLDNLKFLHELIIYKFGSIDFVEFDKYHIVWTSKNTRSCYNDVVLMSDFDGDIKKDSLRFWRMCKVLLGNLEKNEN